MATSTTVDVDVRPVHCPKCDTLLGRVWPRREVSDSGTTRPTGNLFVPAVTTLHLVPGKRDRAYCPECGAETLLR